MQGSNGAAAQWASEEQAVSAKGSHPNPLTWIQGTLQFCLNDRVVSKDYLHYSIIEFKVTDCNVCYTQVRQEG